MEQDSWLSWKPWILAGLEDDGWRWDWTTLGCLREPDQQVRARLVAKADGVWAGDGCLRALEFVSREFGGEIRVTQNFFSGNRVKPGDVIATWEGPARLILAFERPVLNLVQYVSGIATSTRALCDALEAAWPKTGAPLPRVTSTRKTLPGYRDLAVLGVRQGGGEAHRVSLSGGVLIKENHIAAAGGIHAAIEGARKVAPHGLKIEIEVQNEAELDQALAARAEVVMLDNFSPSQVRSALSRIPSGVGRPLVEISGGIRLETIAEYAVPGVDVISVGSLTHSSRALDLSLLVDLG